MAKRVYKTTKKLSGGKSSYRGWGDWEIGDMIIGKYIGSDVDQYDKPNFKFLVEEAVFSKTSEAKKLKGQNLTLNSAGQLNKAMKDVEEGQLVQIVYNGTSEIEKGKYKGKDAHQVEVDLVEEDTGEEADDYEASEDSYESQADEDDL